MMRAPAAGPEQTFPVSSYRRVCGPTGTMKRSDNPGVASDAELLALVPSSPLSVRRVGSPRSSGMCCEHDHQIRLSSRPPRRPVVVDHERRSHRLTAQLVSGRNRGMLHKEVATG